MNEFFHSFAVKISRGVGSSVSFVIALLLVLAWAVAGFMNGFTDTWLLIINTSCSVITFLMVILVQNTQTRDNRAVQLKLNELLKSGRMARTDLVGLEDLSDKELDNLQDDFRRLRQEFVERHTRLVEQRLKRG